MAVKCYLVVSKSASVLWRSDSVMSIVISLLLVTSNLICCRYLGISALGTSLTQDETCTQVPGLVSPQIEVCKNNPESLLCISDGARLGITECQYQFRNERWNCTTDTNYTVFGDVLRKGLYLCRFKFFKCLNLSRCNVYILSGVTTPPFGTSNEIV